MSGVAHVILDWLRTAGWPVLFLLMALEMAMLLHGLPTELVMAAATEVLAKSWGSLILAILVATTGSAVGSLLPWAAGYHGGRPFLERHQRFFRLSPQRLARLEEWFRRPAGPLLVAGIRVVPGLRTLPAIPAGLARMPWRPYVALTSLGCLVFNSIIMYATYASAHPGVPLGEDLAAARLALGAELLKLQQYWLARWWLGLALLVVAAVALFFVWRRRHHIRQRPMHSVQQGLRLASWSAAAVGALLLLGAVVAPKATYSLVAWLAIDYAQWATASGFGDAFLVLIVASMFASAAVLGFLLVPLVRGLRRRARPDQPG